MIEKCGYCGKQSSGAYGFFNELGQWITAHKQCYLEIIKKDILKKAVTKK